MSLQHAILGMLDLIGEQSGYDLSTAFDRMAGNVWRADRPQIYRTLAKLQKDGLVNEREDEESGRGRKLYQITDAGQTELQKWLESDWEVINYRDPNLLKLFFGKRIPLERLRAQINSYQEYIAQMQDQLKPAEESIKQGARYLPDDAIFWQLTLDQGRLGIQMLSEWSALVLAKLDEYESQKQSKTGDTE